jgi:hypothetical protein
MEFRIWLETRLAKAKGVTLAESLTAARFL